MPGKDGLQMITTKKKKKNLGQVLKFHRGKHITCVSRRDKNHSVL